MDQATGNLPDPPAVSSAQPPELRSRANMPGLLPIALVIALGLAMAILISFPIHSRFEPPFLVTILNAIFLMVMTCIVAFAAARSYLLGLSPALAPMGAGLVALSGGSFFGGIAIPQGGVNFGVSMHNVGLLLCSIGTVVGVAQLYFLRAKPHHPRLWRLIAWYGGAAFLIFIMLLLLSVERLPRFYTHEGGSTPLRLVVLACASTLYFICAGGLTRLAFENRSPFLGWYAAGTALFGLACAGLTGLSQVGSPLSWVARTAQYVGAVYLLMALVMEMRSSQRWVISIEALRETYQRYVSLVETSPDGIFINCDGKFVFVNQACAKMLGFDKPSDLHGRTVFDFVPEKEQAGISRRIKTILEEHVPVPPRETYFKTRDGQLLEVEATASPVQFRGRPAVQVILRDIRERKAIERGRRAAELRLRRILDNLFAFVALLEIDGTLIEANRAPFTVAGIEPKDVIGKHFADTYWWAYDPAIQAQIREAVARAAAGEIVRFDINARVAGGALMPIDFQIAPIYDNDGKMVNLVPSGVNITERVQANQALSEAAAAAEAALAEAERANNAKDQFIAALSHELRTPLTPIMAIAETLRNDPRLPPDVQADLATVKRNVELETHLVSDLLDVSRVLSGKMHLLTGTLDGATVIRDAAAIVGPDLQTRRQTLDIKMHGTPYAIEGDAARLQQVFWNLLRNASKFSPEGSAISLIAQRVERYGQPFLEVQVADKGAGIAPELLPKLFTPFEQGGARGLSALSGLGLGLAIAKGIVSLHHGSIEAASEGPGKGACFTVRLPLSSMPLTVPGSGKAPAHAIGKRRALRILLVEDHEDTARLMARLLRADGHRLTTAMSVSQALAAAGSEDFDLIISDIGLPDGTGMDVLARWPADKRGLPAIALSGYGTPADVERSLAAGFREHLTKPVNIDLLQRTINELINDEVSA